MTLLILIPWVLTLAVLTATILFRSRKTDSTDIEDDYDDFFDGESPVEIRVAIYGERAYWVYNNTFYESEVSREPDFDTARPINIDSLSQEEMKKLFTVLDDLENSIERD